MNTENKEDLKQLEDVVASLEIRTTQTKKDNGEVDFNMSLIIEPTIDASNVKEYVRLITAGIRPAVSSVLVHTPILRPATDIELQNNFYYFESDKDNELFKARQGLYRLISSEFFGILETYFPDIMFIEACTEKQQEFVFDHSKEEADEYQQELQAHIEEVKELLQAERAEEAADNASQNIG